MDMDALITSLKTPLAMAGKRVLIAGAAGGIGSATARIMSDLGAKLVLVDRLPADQLAAKLGPSIKAEMYSCDTSKRAEVDKLAAEVGTIDALIDAAGVCPFEDWNNADWDASFDLVIDVNLRGPINLSRAFVPAMRANGGGRIVFCGSVAGWTGGVRGGPHYAAAKGGVHAFLRWLSNQVAKGNILVNAVAPGTTDTPMTQGQGYNPDYYPQKRFARAEEIGGVITFLCTPASGFMSGAILDINGGTYFH